MLFRQINAKATTTTAKQMINPTTSLAKMNLTGNSQDGNHERITLVVENTRFVIDPCESKFIDILFFLFLCMYWLMLQIMYIIFF